MSPSEELYTIDEWHKELTEALDSYVKSRKRMTANPKSELKRQINIAQVGVSFFHHRNIKTSGRVLDVCLDYDGDVAAWAEEQKLP